MIQGQSSPPQTKSWHNAHLVFYQNYQDDRFLMNNHPTDSSQAFADYNAQTANIMSLIGSIVANHSASEIRGLGNGWSLSKAAATQGIIFHTDQLKISFPVVDGYVDPNSRFKNKPGYLYFVQCGMQLFDLHSVLFSAGKSLPVSGSSCDQTIVGAFSTGTHGAAIHGGGGIPGLNGKDWGGGAVHDYVRGLHIILGPNRHVFLQRQSDPAVTAEFGGIFNVSADNFILSDDLFDAALVSFGAFGFIHGVLLEVVDLFVLHATRYKITTGFASLQAAMTQFDFTNVNLNRPNPNDKTPPYHFEVFRNPNASVADEAVVMVMDKTPYPPGFQSTVPKPGTPPNDDISSLANLLTQVSLGALTPLMASLLFGQTYFPFDCQGTIGQINPKLGPIGPGSIVLSLAIDMKDILQVMSISDTYRQKHNCLVWHDIRFMPQSKGLLGFQKFPQSCSFEIAGIGSPDLILMINEVLAQMRQDSIGFAFHWGKYLPLGPNETRYGGWTSSMGYVLDPGELARIYGANLTKWKNEKAALFNDAKLENLFRNDLMRSLGL